MTVALYGEDHTLGNALREQISNKYVTGIRNFISTNLNVSPHVELCAYSIPHPSENKIHIRIQTDGTDIFYLTIFDNYRIYNRIRCFIAGSAGTS